MSETLFDLSAPEPDLTQPTAADAAEAQQKPGREAPAEHGHRRFAGQWRLSEVQLANWGTFDKGIYRIDIARKGHLITGPSGSGKSSLLDAIAAVLTPDKWLRFNLAAQTAGSRRDQRSLVSYVRGAWTRVTDEDEDRVVSKFLRPTATWSGVILRYEDGMGKTVSLARLFFIKGSGVNTRDLNDLCIFEDTRLDLLDLQKYAKNGLETRKLQADRPAALVTTNGKHGKFYARMRRVFGIESESALQLLHRTQSAKSLDNLDRLFRDFMLQEPRTFAIADTAVQQFGDLSEAHLHVVQLRKQRDHLLSLRTVSDEYDSCLAKQERAGALNSLLPPFLKRRELSMLREQRQHLQRSVTQKRAQLEEAREEEQRAASEHETAKRTVLDSGGAEVEILSAGLRTAQEQRDGIEGRRARFATQLKAVGIERVPQTAEEFAELQTQVAAEVESTQQPVPVRYEDNDRLAKARREVQHVEAEISALRRSGSTVPEYLQRVRGDIAQSIGIPADAMPFAAELIEVKPEYADWTGAIERVLRPFALTLLVRSRYLSAVRVWADTHEVRGRLVFEEVSDDSEAPAAALHPDSLVNRIDVTASSIGAWAAREISVRYDYVCVNTPDDLGKYAKAVTIRGQLKTSRSRYEKDDRRRINDRSNWVLGDQEEKLSALADRLDAARKELEAAESVVEKAARAERERNIRRGRLETILDGSWAEYDVTSTQKTIVSLTTRLDALTSGDSKLSAALEAERALQEAHLAARQTVVDMSHEVRTAEQDLQVCAADIQDIEDLIAAGGLPEVPAADAQQLEKRLLREQRSIKLKNLHEVGQRVSTALQAEKDAAQKSSERASQLVVELTTGFKAQWPMVASELKAGVEDRAGYLKVLDDILANGLPEHEARFRRLLHERSQDLVGELLNEILSAPAEIKERTEPINSVLARKPFDAGRYLYLEPKTRRSPVVEKFLAQLREILDGSWSDEDMAAAERKYEVLAEIMNRFASSEHVDRSWRSQCLDTRTHVRFFAHEIDDQGQPTATYDSGASMSGGQQQKLVVFCLAAALRYQLAQRDEEVPRYGTVILDEAFDKADTRYTRMALDIFVEFGFHLVLATPQKLLQTIEAYVGAVTEIDNPTRQRSQIAVIDWSKDPDAEPNEQLDGAAG